MRWAVLLFAAVISATYACADNIALDFAVGAWAIEKYGYPESSTRAGPMVGADLRVPWDTVAYEATVNYRRYNGVAADGSVFGVENRFPIYFTGEPLRVYAAPGLGLWQFKYGLGLPPVYGSGESDFALSLGGGLGLRVVGAAKGSYLDLGYFYQGTKITGPEGFFGSRRILRAKGNIGITSHVGFGLEAGTVEEGWSFVTVSNRTGEVLSTFYAGSPYLMFGPHFSF